MPAALKGVTVATYDATAASFPLAYGLSRDGRLQAPVWNGEPRQAAPATLRTAARPDGGWSFALDIPACVWQDDERLRPAFTSISTCGIICGMEKLATDICTLGSAAEEA